MLGFPKFPQVRNEFNFITGSIENNTNYAFNEFEKYKVSIKKKSRMSQKNHLKKEMM